MGNTPPKKKSFFDYVSDYNPYKEKKEEKKEEKSFFSSFTTFLMIGGLVILLPGIGFSVLGFSTTGIVAGSWAAGAQAAVGNIASGSFISIMTSLGMKGIFVKMMAAGGSLFCAGFLPNFLGDK